MGHKRNDLRCDDDVYSPPARLTYHCRFPSCSCSHPLLIEWHWTAEERKGASTQSTLYEMRWTTARKQCDTAGSGVLKPTSRHLLEASGNISACCHRPRSRGFYKRGGMRWSDSRFNPWISALISSVRSYIRSGSPPLPPFDLTADRRDE